MYCSVLRRLVTLISSEATLTASKEAAIKQAKSASDMAKKLMEDNDKVIKLKICADDLMILQSKPNDVRRNNNCYLIRYA